MRCRHPATVIFLQQELSRARAFRPHDRSLNAVALSEFKSGINLSSSVILKCMTKTPDTLKDDSKEKTATEQDLLRQKALKALQHLREIGEKLPCVDAAHVIREGRDLAESSSR